MNKRLYTGKVWNVELVVRLGSFWVGCHYSSINQSYCVALIPCVVVRFGKTNYFPTERKCA